MSVSPAVATPINVETPSLCVNPQVAQPTSSKPDNKETANGVENASPSESVMAKEERRRFKKLRKKAAKFRPESDLSGLVNRDEWEEAKETRLVVLAEENNEKNSNNDNNGSENPKPKQDDFCPWIGRRRTKRLLEEKEKPRDGFDHRLVLKSLHLQHRHSQKDFEVRQTQEGGVARKRKREDSPRNGSFNIPKWVSLHNPVCVDHMAVLEIQIQGNDLSVGSVAKILTSTHNKDPVSKKDGNTKPLIPESSLITTEWFQGPRPQSISDVLLYEKPNQPPSKKNKHDTGTGTTTTKLEKTLATMTLSEQQMKQEGYPVVVKKHDTNVQVNTLVPGEFRKPTSISLDEAKAIVSQLHVEVDNEDVPFVMDVTQEYSIDDGDIKVYGLDCEMVKTDTGKTELGRITLIQYTDTDNHLGTKEATDRRYRILMDELVLPYRPILDYVTQYSGLTADLLQNVKTRLEQVQASLLTLVRPQDILVGHSLENDLIATRWVHPTVIDTAVLFRSSGSFKHSLKHLSNCLLKKKIQGGAHHCSEEDAAAALELAIGRAEQGPTFTIHARDRLFWIPTEKKHNEAATVFIGPSQWLQSHVTRHPNALHALTCDTIDSPNRKAILSWLTGPKRRAGMVWANLVVATPEHLTLLGELLLDLHSKMSASTVLMINVQPSPLEALDMCKQKRLCQNPRTTLAWSDDDEAGYQASVDKCRSGTVAWVTLHDGS